MKAIEEEVSLLLILQSHPCAFVSHPAVEIPCYRKVELWSGSPNNHRMKPVVPQCLSDKYEARIAWDQLLVTCVLISDSEPLLCNGET